MTTDSPNTTLKSDNHPAVSVTVWLLRLFVGAVFIFSGWSKAIDPWGGLYKILEYLSAMGYSASRPEALVLACSLATFEFTLGITLLTGCLRRLSVWLLVAVMCVMTPLTLWIWMTDPVPDCGCFGDALVLSNKVTFIKNLVLCVCAGLLVWLNGRVRPLITPRLQWIAIIASIFYCLILQWVGYNTQPMADFRPYPIGGPLIHEADAPKYLYARGGVVREFDASDLPGDDWEYIAICEDENPVTTIAISDTTGTDITEDLVSLSEDEGGLLLFVVCEPRYHGISRSRMANRLYDYQRIYDGNMAAVVATEKPSAWRETMRANYPVYTADDTDLKALVRGDAALVYILNDTIRWKYNITAVAPDLIPMDIVDDSEANLIKDFNPAPASRELVVLTLLLVAVIVILILAGEIARLFNRLRHKNPKNISGDESPVKKN